MGAFFRVSEGGGYNLYGPTSRVVPGAGGPSACPPHALGCRGSGVPQEMGARSALNGERDG
jgi:hypothetical protein